MQFISEFPKQRFRQMYRIYRLSIQTVLLLCFLLLTFALIQETWQSQHSCQPMIEWSGELPSACLTKSSSPQPYKSDPSYPKPKPPLPCKSVPNCISEEPPLPPPDVIGIAAGTVAATGLVIVGTPMAVAVVAGFTIWLALRTIL